MGKQTRKAFCRLLYGRVCIVVLLALVPLLALVSGSAWARPLSPASESLRIAAGAPHAAFWRRIYSAVPDCWKATRPIVVQEVSDAELERMVAKDEGGDSRADTNSSVDGCYEYGEAAGDPDTITLCETLQGEEAALVFTHEYGHYVWDRLLTAAQRVRYRRLWREQKQAKHLVTDYAGETDEEGFAEAFSYFLRQPSTLRRADQRSWQFLTDLEKDQTAAISVPRRRP